MKHSEAAQELRRQLTALGVSTSETKLESVLDHLDWLLTENERVNLTAVTDVQDALRLHVVDSLAAAHALKEAPAGRALDLGTGGGFPGLPLAIWSGRDFTLLDSVKKKAAALREYVVARGLHVRVLDVRSERLSIDEPASFAVVIARAVAPLPSLVELAAPLLVQSGRLLALKGQPSDEELDAGVRAAEIVGLRQLCTHAYELAGGERRVLVVYEKVGEALRPLPRREGLAQRKPLA